MNIQQYLSERGVTYECHHHAPAYTAQELAAEEHVSGRKTAKAVVVRTPTQFAMCVLPAHRKLDMVKAARALRAKQVELADESHLARLFPDSEIGAEPPFGRLYNLETLIDRSLAEEDEVVFEAGRHDESIRMNCREYMSLAQPTIADIAAGA
jgi:Ala-tRNA(Pro) deacylase